MTIADPLGALATIIVGWHETSAASKWLKLVFGIVLSYLITFNTVAGGCLIAKMGWAVSVGSGMVTGAAMALTAYLRANAKLTEGIVIAIPQQTTLDSVNDKGQGPEVITAKGKP